MKLRDLAQAAAALPSKAIFQWDGLEHHHDDVFARDVTSLPEAIVYIDGLRKRMAAYAMALHELQSAYLQMREIMLEAEVSDLASKQS